MRLATLCGAMVLRVSPLRCAPVEMTNFWFGHVTKQATTKANTGFFAALRMTSLGEDATERKNGFVAGAASSLAADQQGEKGQP
jgi:hypothetical protein